MATSVAVTCRMCARSEEPKIVNTKRRRLPDHWAIVTIDAAPFSPVHNLVLCRHCVGILKALLDHGLSSAVALAQAEWGIVKQEDG